MAFVVFIFITCAMHDSSTHIKWLNRRLYAVAQSILPRPYFALNAKIYNCFVLFRWVQCTTSMTYKPTFQRSARSKTGFSTFIFCISLFSSTIKKRIVLYHLCSLSLSIWIACLLACNILLWTCFRCQIYLFTTRNAMFFAVVAAAYEDCVSFFT